MRLTFILKGNADDCKWIVSALDTLVATVVPTGHEEGGWFSYPVQSFEITAVHPGCTLLGMSFMNKRNAPMRSFRCCIEVK